MKVVVFGGTGILGTELSKINSELICHSSKIDIRNYHYIRAYLTNEQPHIVINAAAVINNRDIEKDSTEAIKTNIIGASNLALICKELNIRLVYISTDYIYNGTQLGNHSEVDNINPTNLYAWTKLGGECATKCVENHLIIRTSFGKSEFSHGVAFSNQFTSKDYVDIIAPMILKASLSDVTGVINIGTKRKSMYEYAVERNPSIPEFSDIKIDHSLNIDKYNFTFNSEFNETK